MNGCKWGPSRELATLDRDCQGPHGSRPDFLRRLIPTGMAGVR